jgi:hypothetical protein
MPAGWIKQSSDTIAVLQTLCVCSSGRNNGTYAEKVASDRAAMTPRVIIDDFYS